MYQFVKRLITFLVRYGIILKYNVIDQSVPLIRARR